MILNKNVSGVNVISVFDDELNEDQQYRIAYAFYENGLPIAFERHSYKLHDKLFVIDKQVAIGGSYNPIGSATSDNDESIVIIHSKFLAGKVSKHIEEMFNKWYTPDYIWTAPHPVINEVYYYWTSTQWVEIYNPTNEVIDLSNWLIGDAENIFGDNEGMYRFPEGAMLPPSKYIIVAYDAVEFKRT